MEAKPAGKRRKERLRTTGIETITMCGKRIGIVRRRDKHDNIP